MKIGYACIPKTISARTSRSLLLKNFNYDNFIRIASDNINDLMLILEHNIENNIFMFRISSDIIPLGSHPVNNINWSEIFKDNLEAIGEFIKKNKIRVSMHPGQYTVINSNSEDVVTKSLKDIEYHTKFLDSLKLDYTNKIVLHIGGVYGDKDSAIKRFILNFERLSLSARHRLVIENDDKSYNINDVLRISHILNIPTVFDNLHHELNHSGESNLQNILKEVFLTWTEKDGAMKLHYSDSSIDKKVGAHSQFVITKKFLTYYHIVNVYNPDIMLEVKDKDISAIKCLQCLSEGSKHILYDMWAKYKYLVMEKNYKLYKECSSLVKTNCSIIEFYEFVDATLLLPINEKNFCNAAEHVWGYFKEVASIKEKERFSLYINNYEFNYKLKLFLYKLAIKYNQPYLLSSYYFYY